MERIIAALNQTSTWRGLIAIATAVGITLSPEEQNAIIAVGLAIIGLINIIRQEHKGDTIIAKQVNLTGESTIQTTTKGN